MLKKLAPHRGYWLPRVVRVFSFSTSVDKCTKLILTNALSTKARKQFSDTCVCSVNRLSSRNTVILQTFYPI